MDHSQSDLIIWDIQIPKHLMLHKKLIDMRVSGNNQNKVNEGGVTVDVWAMCHECCVMYSCWFAVSAHLRASESRCAALRQIAIRDSRQPSPSNSARYANCSKGSPKVKPLWCTFCRQCQTRKGNSPSQHHTHEVTHERRNSQLSERPVAVLYTDSSSDSSSPQLIIASSCSSLFSHWKPCSSQKVNQPNSIHS